MFIEANNICLINDNSFYKLLPDWNIDISKMVDPLKSNMRKFAIAEILYKYGGMHVPSSFICNRSN